MTNRDISLNFKLLADLMELHDENPFKYKAYANAYLTLKKVETDLSNKTIAELQSITGIGKNIAEKIIEQSSNGEVKALEEFRKITPTGLIDILSIKGLGPKKVRTIWKELEVTEISELLLACTENRLVEIKGFGFKTQQEIINKIEFFYSNKGFYHYASIIRSAERLIDKLRNNYPDELSELTASIRMKDQVVQGIEILTTLNTTEVKSMLDSNESDEKDVKNLFENFPVIISTTEKDSFYTDQIRLSSCNEFYKNLDLSNCNNAKSEEEIFDKNNLTYVIPEYRVNQQSFEQSKTNSLPKFIELLDIKGVIHNHSNYSDGLNSIKEMSDECMKQGYEYFVISDHSRSATYAKGMVIERVFQQWQEIEKLNQQLTNFRIFKSIESDILGDGSLDYPDDILSGFDLVIASIHSNLKMNMDKATTRLIIAIENPHTDILGHPTGRLLLGREGYPIDHKKVIDACAANDVVIELNANPQRLDLDWNWIPYALEKNVMISINPDAHSLGQIEYIKYGINVARKAGLEASMCLNSLSISEFECWTKR